MATLIRFFFYPPLFSHVIEIKTFALNVFLTWPVVVHPPTVCASFDGFFPVLPGSSVKNSFTVISMRSKQKEALFLLIEFISLPAAATHSQIEGRNPDRHC